MEISLLASDSLKIKGKQTFMVINPRETGLSYSTALVLNAEKDTLKLKKEDVVLEGPGDYEIEGVKITGTRFDDMMTYGLVVDDVNILFAANATIAKNNSKMKDYDVIVVHVAAGDDTSTVVNLAKHAVVYFGDKAKEIVKDIPSANKFVITKDKFTEEVQQLVLV